MKINEQEMRLLAGTDSPEEAAGKLFADRTVSLCITMEANGCYHKTRNSAGMVPAISVDVCAEAGIPLTLVFWPR